jgi:rRNA maturation RNase YbeY
MPVDLLNRQRHVALDLPRLERLTERAAAVAGVGARRVEAALVDDELITVLNRDCFGKNRPTTVISVIHDAGDDDNGAVDPAMDRGEPEACRELLGEVAVSVETVLRETAGLGYEPEEAILYYLLHGLLHLVGHEHVGVDEERAARMFRLQDEIFARLLGEVPEPELTR